MCSIKINILPLWWVLRNLIYILTQLKLYEALFVVLTFLASSLTPWLQLVCILTSNPGFFPLSSSYFCSPTLSAPLSTPVHFPLFSFRLLFPSPTPCFYSCPLPLLLSSHYCPNLLSLFLYFPFCINSNLPLILPHSSSRPHNSTSAVPPSILPAPLSLAKHFSPPPPAQLYSVG